MKPYQKPNLNIWTKGWYGWHPCNWWNNIKHFFREIKWSYQRITKGYCDWDVWDLDSYYSDLIHNTLLHLRDTTHGYPANMTEEAWADWLTQTAECFYKGNEANDAYENRYEEEAVKLFDKWTWEPSDHDTHVLHQNYTPEEEALNQEYLNREIEIAMIREQEIKRGLMRLSDKWYSFWD